MNGRQAILGSQDGARSLTLRLSDKNGKVGVQVSKNSGGVLTFQYTAPKGNWTHYTWSNSSETGLSLYINGTHIQTIDWTRTHDFVAPIDVLGSTGFIGHIDDLKIYNRPLTAAEVISSMQVKGLNVAETNLNLFIGESHQINVDLISEHADQTITYTVNNPEIASVDAKGHVTALKKGETLLIIENKAGGYRKEVPITIEKRLEIQYTIPTYKMPKENLSDIEKAPGTNRQYLAHPDMLMLDDNKTLLTSFVVGHGRGPIVMKVSRDAGETWIEKSNLPKSWANSWETPTLYKLNFKNGSQKLIMITGRPNWHGNKSGGWDTSISTDNGETWSEYKQFHPTKEDGSQNWSVVAMSSLVQLKDESGNFIDKWMGLYIDGPAFNNYKTYLTFDENGNEQWSAPERLLPDYRDIEAAVQLSEVGVFRSPDGKRLVALGRSQSHQHKSTMFYSDDEGTTWTRPEFMQGALQGERHKIAYDPISGRLLVTFREIILDYNKNGKIERGDWRAGEWVAWVGTYEDIMNQNEGQYRIVLAEDWAQNTYSGDTGYAGLTVTPDGMFIMNSYGHFDKEFSEQWAASHPKEAVTTDLSYIKQAKFKLGQIDQALGLVDKSKLLAALIPLEAIASKDYTEESYQKISKKVAIARSIHDSEITQQIEIDRALAELVNVSDILVRREKSSTPNLASLTDMVSRRVLKDKATGVQVVLAAGEDANIIALRIVPKETGHIATPTALKDVDYDLFDIELVDKYGKIIKMVGYAEVSLPVDVGKEVTSVVYLPNSDKLVNLPFRSSEVIDENGQPQKVVIFTAEHFSEYAIIYKSAPVLMESGLETIVPTTQQFTQTSITETQINGSPNAGKQHLPTTGENESDLAILGSLALISTFGLVNIKKQED